MSNFKEIKKEELKKVNLKKIEADKIEEKKKELEAVKRLKCDYQLFKEERTKSDMRVPDTCDICGRRFDGKDNIYVAWGKDLKELFICKNCAGDNNTKKE